MNILEEYEEGKGRTIGRHVEIDGRTYDIEIQYRMGGMNWATSQVDARGYRLSVKPAERSTLPGGQQVRSFVAFSGNWVMLQPANSFSALSLRRLAYNVFHNMEQHETLQKLILAVQKKNGWA